VNIFVKSKFDRNKVIKQLSVGINAKASGRALLKNQNSFIISDHQLNSVIQALSRGLPHTHSSAGGR
jgi:hypothetical protein